MRLGLLNMRTLDSQALLEALLNTLPQIIYFKDAEGRFTLVSRSLAEFHELDDPEQMIGKSDFDFHAHADALQYQRDEQQIMSSGKPIIEKEERCIGPTGRVRWYLSTKVPIRGATGQIVGIAGSSHDITDRRKVDAALRESEERFRRVFESDIIGIHFWDADGNVTQANDAYLRMIGYTRHELETRHVRWRDLTPPEFASQDDQAIAQMKSRGVCPPFEKMYVRKDGGRMPILLGAALLPESKHEGVAFALDLTERKQAENALRESEQRFRALAEHSSVGFWRIAISGHTLYINPAMCSMLEIQSGAELEGRTFHEFFTPESLDTLKREHAKRGSGVHSTYEAEIIGRRGGRRNVLISGSPLLAADGSLSALIGTFTDMTEHKKGLRRLHQQRQEQQIIFDSVPAMIWYKDCNNRIIRSNRAAAAAIGLTPAQMEGRSVYDLYPTEAAAYHRDDLEVIKSGLPKMGIIEQLRMPNGQSRWIRTDKIPYRDDQGQIIGVIVFATDITDLKQAEEALQREQHLMQILMDNMPDAIYFKDRDSRFLRTNAAHAKIMGLASPQEAIGRADADFFAPEAAAEFRADESSVIESGRSLINRVECHGGSTGEMRWWSTTKVPIRDPGGEVVGIAGITRDITLLTRAAEEIRTLNQELEQRVADRTARLESANRQLEAEVAERRQAEQKIGVYQQRLRSLASELALTEERERRKIAVDLHDQIGQTLALIQIKLQSAREALGNRSSPHQEVVDHLDECVELIRPPIHDIRSLVFVLSPPVLYDLGFEAAAAWLVEQHDGKLGIRVEFSDDEQPKPLDQAVAVLLFRAIRELLTNIIKHSHAKHARVWLKRDGNTFCASVEDDGRGFDAAPSASNGENGSVATSSPNGFGLFSIREQLDRIGGRMHIQSSPGQGCQIVLTAPIQSHS
jgi:PAS domain S-box-containing protein